MFWFMLSRSVYTLPDKSNLSLCVQTVTKYAVNMRQALGSITINLITA